MRASELIAKLEKADENKKIYTDIVGNGTSVDTIYFYPHHNPDRLYIADYLPKGATEIRGDK